MMERLRKTSRYIYLGLIGKKTWSCQFLQTMTSKYYTILLTTVYTW